MGADAPRPMGLRYHVFMRWLDGAVEALASVAIKPTTAIRTGLVLGIRLAQQDPQAAAYLAQRLEGEGGGEMIEENYRAAADIVARHVRR